MRAEISYDLVMEEEMSFAEGTFRLPEGEWQAFIFIRRNVTDRPIWWYDRWESGVTGIVVAFPNGRMLSRGAIETVLSEALGVSEWTEVRGPDSIALR